MDRHKERKRGKRSEMDKQTKWKREECESYDGKERNGVKADSKETDRGNKKARDREREKKKPENGRQR